MRGLNLYLFHISDNQILDKICTVIVFDFGRFTVTTDKQKALKCDCIYNIDVFLQKKGFMHLFTFIIKSLTNTDVPARLAHFTHSASIF